MEKDLLNEWENSQYPYSTLRRLSVHGDPGLRGIKDLDVTFAYPLTVFCGKNGTGKSTLLALSALAFHYIPGQTSALVPGQPTRFTFSDFFYKGPGDPDLRGIRIEWGYKESPFDSRTKLAITKRSEKWMHYERRPARPVYFLGMGRCLPAVDQRVLRSYFPPRASARELPLDSEFRAHLSAIMGRPYDEASVLSSRYVIRRCSSGATYSSFNMGAGEDSLIELLYVLQMCPRGSMVVVEEIETSLHPEAVIALAEHLQEITLKKRLQVVVSSHSSHFIDSVPRIARVLLQRINGDQRVTAGPTTRYATGIMSGQSNPELQVYCEDVIAERLLHEALASPNLRRRTRITSVGSNHTLAYIAAAHLKAGHKERLLLVWDGDTSAALAEKWLVEAGLWDNKNGAWHSGLNWAFIPGGQPEQWVLDTLDCAEGYAGLQRELRLDTPADAAQLIAEMKTLPDLHDLGYELTNRLGEPDALRFVIRALADLPGAPLASLKDAVESVLAGRTVRPAKAQEALAG